MFGTVGAKPFRVPRPPLDGRHQCFQSKETPVGVEPTGCSFAGGTPRGCVIGGTDAIGGEVKDNPVSPKDILATAFHLLGVDPNTLVNDQLGRPIPIAGDGIVRAELCSG